MSTVVENPTASLASNETSIESADQAQISIPMSAPAPTTTVQTPASTNDPAGAAAATASSNSPATPNNTSTGTPTKGSAAATSGNNNTSAHPTNTNTSSAQTTPSKNSFVMVKLDYQCVPFVSLQFLFHSNVSYSDRMRLIEEFKAKLNEFRTAVALPPPPPPITSSLASPSVVPSSTAGINTTNASSLLLTPTSSIYTTQQSAVAAFAQHRQSSIINLSFDEQNQLTAKSLNSSVIQAVNIGFEHAFRTQKLVYNRL